MSTNERIRGRALQRIRRAALQDNPCCVLCLARGKVAEAVQIDHIIALANGGKDTDENRQALCRACHDAKTRQDLGYRTRHITGANGWPIPRAKCLWLEDCKYPTCVCRRT